jgi:hypothetical protein
MPSSWGRLRALFDEEAGDSDGVQKNRGFSINRARPTFYGGGEIPGWKGGPTRRMVAWAKRVIEIWAASVAMYGHRQGKASAFPKEPVYEQGRRATLRSASAAAAYEAACVRNNKDGGAS